MLEAEQVLVARVDDDVRRLRVLEDARVEEQVDVDVVNAGVVGASCGLRVLRVDGVRPDVDELARDVGVVLVRLHQAEEGAGACLNARCVVERHLDRRDGVEDEARASESVVVKVASKVKVEVVLDLVLRAHRKNVLHHDVVELKAHGHLGVGRVFAGRGALRRRRLHRALLHLREDLLELAVRKLGALVVVEVHVAGFDQNLEVRVDERREAAGASERRIESRLAVGSHVHGPRRRRRHGGGDDNAVGALRERNLEHHVVELQGHEREREARVLGEGERQGDVQPARAARRGLAQGHRVVLANHLAQALARLAGELLPHEQVRVVERVDDRAADAQLDLLKQVLANRVGPVARVFAGGNFKRVAASRAEHNARQPDLGVRVPHQVALALKRELDVGGSKARGAVAVRLDGLHREGRVLHVNKAPVRDVAALD